MWKMRSSFAHIYCSFQSLLDELRKKVVDGAKETADTRQLIKVLRLSSVYVLSLLIVIVIVFLMMSTIIMIMAMIWLFLQEFQGELQNMRTWTLQVKNINNSIHHFSCWMIIDGQDIHILFPQTTSGDNWESYSRPWQDGLKGTKNG